ncbi:MAG: substrate-binding domain-containing protein, partial [Clostridiales bacterium]|nr:substrate-binding domain-containing protein [Clostridiales bacterium]
ALEAALHRRGVPFDASHILQTVASMDAGDKLADSLVKVCPKGSALVCFNDLCAIGVLRGLFRLNLRVPEDYSVVGFDNIEINPFPLTTVNIPEYDMATAAAEMLFNAIENPTAPPAKVCYSVNLVEKQSVR